MPGGMTPISNTDYLNAYGYGGPAYDRVTSIPNWLPQERTGELMDQYRNTNTMFDTGAYDQASQAQESRMLTQGLNAGNNAATDYANRARQSGGSAMGAGLVKAEAQTGARAQAGQMKLQRHQYDTEQREKAATHATAIATTLGQLRDSYLKSIVEYATKEDGINADFAARMAAIPRPHRPRPGDVSGVQIGATHELGGLSFQNYNQFLDWQKYANNTYGGPGGGG